MIPVQMTAMHETETMVKMEAVAMIAVTREMTAHEAIVIRDRVDRTTHALTTQRMTAPEVHMEDLPGRVATPAAPTILEAPAAHHIAGLAVEEVAAQAAEVATVVVEAATTVRTLSNPMTTDHVVTLCTLSKLCFFSEERSVVCI